MRPIFQVGPVGRSLGLAARKHSSLDVFFFSIHPRMDVSRIERFPDRPMIDRSGKLYRWFVYFYLPPIGRATQTAGLAHGQAAQPM